VSPVRNVLTDKSNTDEGLINLKSVVLDYLKQLTKKEKAIISQQVTDQTPISELTATYGVSTKVYGRRTKHLSGLKFRSSTGKELQNLRKSVSPKVL